MSNSKGSEWRIWDLHLHSPFTKLSDNFKSDRDFWETFSDKIETSEVAVFGITDYFCCENYFHFSNFHRNRYPLSEKVFFLNIEFRLNIAVNAKLEEINLHVIFSNQVPKNKIDSFLISLKTNITNESGVRISCKDLAPNQFVSATIDYNELIDCLKQNFGKNRPYLIVASANNAGLRPISESPRKLNLTDEIDKICDCFFGGRQNLSYYLKTNRYETPEYSKPKPVLTGCDAHSFEDIDLYLGKYVERTNPANSQTEIHKDITWIKADTTFEGLKQVLFEPEHRIKISEIKPREPIRKIESIKFSFPASSYIKRNTSSERQQFCLNQLKSEIQFSPYFTCLIGGRGTGKSTIINLLGERLGEKTEFFKQNSLLIDSNPYGIESDINNVIEIIGTNEIEFVSQGKIENLAEGNELTKLIFNERIRDVEPEFYSLDNEINSIATLIDDTIRLLFELSQTNNIVKEKSKERETIQNIINSVNDDRYKEITKRINDIRKEVNSINDSHRRYTGLLETLRNILLEIKPNDADNDYEKRTKEILTTIQSIDELSLTEHDVTITQKVYESIKNKIDETTKEFIAENQKLKDFFIEKGMSEDTIKDSQQANENLARINLEIQEAENRINRIKDIFVESSKKIDQLPTLYSTYSGLVNKNISLVNKRLQINNENVLDIKFAFEFNSTQFKENLFEEFYSTFSKFHISGTSSNSVKEVLFIIEPGTILEMDYKTFYSKLESEIEINGYRKINNYVKIVLDIFSNSINFVVYKLIIKEHLYNFSKYIKVNGYYGERELQSCSFGQRCTAVVITLLMTGVKPLVIDEPEAHLDNRLIADYLVNLVKNKKSDRQIIFATHNSNFVINGDSELIHILEIPATSIFTNITSTTIENTTYRENLLKLEGGKDAFMIREQKYGLKL